MEIPDQAGDLPLEDTESRIARICAVMAWMTLILASVIALSILAISTFLFLFPQAEYRIHGVPAPAVSPLARLTAFVFAWIWFLPIFRALWHARRIFLTLRRKAELTLAVGAHLRSMGGALMAYPFVTALSEAIVTATVTDRLSVTFSLDDFVLLCVGVLLIVLGHVIVLGFRLRAEETTTVPSSAMATDLA
jgi:hypothetical protein